MTDPKNYAAIFEDDTRGAAILEDLVARFSKPAVVRGGIDAVLETYQRLWQTSVVSFIETMELRIAFTARSDAWMATQDACMRNNSTFLIWTT